MRLIISVVCTFLLLISTATVAHAQPTVGTDPGRWSHGREPVVDVKDRVEFERPGNYKGVVNPEYVSGKPTSTTIYLNINSPQFFIYTCTEAGTVFVEDGTVIVCVDPADPTPGADGRAAAEQYVLDYARRLPLGKPRIEMSSPNGVAGATHYVNLNMSTERIFVDSSAPSGQLNLRAYAVITVNWGDGTKNVYYESGSPGLNSTINHSWNNKGTYSITATANWTVHWTLGPYSGVLAGVPATTTLPNWEVHQLRAVIRQG